MLGTRIWLHDPVLARPILPGQEVIAAAKGPVMDEAGATQDRWELGRAPGLCKFLPAGRAARGGSADVYLMVAGRINSGYNHHEEPSLLCSPHKSAHAAAVAPQSPPSRILQHPPKM